MPRLPATFAVLVDAVVDDGGVVGYVRSNEVGDTISTVDGVTVPAGAIVTVLALQREAGGKSGHYGSAASADQAIPDAG